MSLHTKNCVCRSNGVACGQYKDKEEKTQKKIKRPKKRQQLKFRKTEKKFPVVQKNIFSIHVIRLLTGSKTVTCSVHAYGHTDRCDTPEGLQREALTGLSELPPFGPLSRSGLILIGHNTYWTALIIGRSLKGLVSIGYSVVKTSVGVFACYRSQFLT